MVLREIFVKLGLNVNEQQFARGQLAADLLKTGLERIVEAAKEMVDQFVETVKETVEAGNRIEELAQQTGLSVEELQNMTSAAAATGVATEDVTHSIVFLSRQMFAAKQGSGEAAQAFAKMGVKVKDSGGHLRSANDIMLDLADQFSKMPDGAEKTGKAMALFGRAGYSMIPMLNKGRAELQELAGEFPNLTEEQVKASSEIVKTQRTLRAVTKSLWQSAVAPLLPAINRLLKRYLEWKKENAALIKQKLDKYLHYVASAIDGVTRVMDFLIKNATIIEALVGVALVAAFGDVAIAATIAAVRAAAAWAIAALPFLAIGAAIAAILLIFDDLRVYLRHDGGRSLFGDYQKAIDEWLKPQKNDPWWLTAIKSFTQYLRDAIKLAEDWDIITGKWKPAVSKPNTDDKTNFEQQHKSERNRFIMALMGGIPGLWNYSRENAAGTVSNTQTNNIVINGVPDPKDFADQLHQSMQDYYDGKLSDAGAAAPGQP